MNFLLHQFFLIIGSKLCCDAFSIHNNPTHITMDAGEDLMAFNPKFSMMNLPTKIRIPTENDRNAYLLKSAQSSIGMPWKKSIENEQELTFMTFWEHQIFFMINNLSEIKILPVSNKDETKDFSFAASKGARIANLSLSSKEFRKIRMTYYDAGHQTQVFNSLWYPNPKLNLPVLGIDLLQFKGGKKHLVVIDFQPIQSKDEKLYPHRDYGHFLKAIREEYPSLQGKMSDRFYDENQFFSSEMIFSRFNKEEIEIISEDLRPAFQKSLQSYMHLVRSVDKNEYQQDQVLDRQRAYDVYSAERDPALHLLKAKFGVEWATEFVHDFLFDLSR